MKVQILILLILISWSCASSHKHDIITVPAGSTVLEHFPFKERYRYPEFVPGRVVFISGVFTETMLNYNILTGEMQFIKSEDTLSINNPKSILYIIAQDTFFYNNGYLEVISDEGNIMVAAKKYVNLKEMQKKDPYGTSSAGSARESYNVIPDDVNFYRLRSNTDLVFEKVEDYYITDSGGEFVPFRKTNTTKLFPQKEEEIRNYIRANRIDFSSQADVLKMAAYLRTL